MRAILWIGLMCAVCAPVTAWATPLGTAFTYQGQLKLNGVPVSGTADIIFSLWDAATAGSQLVTTTLTSIPVVNGSFAVTLDFGAAAFPGDERYLQIAARSPSGSGSYVTLGPRQRVTTVPYAMETRGLFVNDALNVGIGTTSPAAKLHVAGTVRAGLLQSDNIIQGADIYTVDSNGAQRSYFAADTTSGGILQL